MTDYVFLSTASVAAILACVALLTVVAAFAVEVLRRPGRGSTAALFGCLAAIWAGAVLVVILIKLGM